MGYEYLMGKPRWRRGFQRTDGEGGSCKYYAWVHSVAADHASQFDSKRGKKRAVMGWSQMIYSFVDPVPEPPDAVGDGIASKWVGRTFWKSMNRYGAIYY